MKRIIALILVLVTCVSLVSCQNGGNTTGNGDTATGAPYEVITDLMKKTNCKDGYGYDVSVPETNTEWVSRAEDITLGALELYGCEGDAQNGYKVVNTAEFGVKFKVKQNLGSLVDSYGSKNGAEGLWVASDSHTGAYDTDIRSVIGVGAYYVKITYSDGTENELTKTDFFANAEKGAALDMVTANDIDSGKTVATIEVTLLYEIYAGAPGNFGVWWHEYTNWRCEYTYVFGEIKQEEPDPGVPFDVYSNVMTRKNCKDGYGYDTSIVESNSNWVSRLDGVELGNLEIYGCEKTDKGYTVINRNAFSIKYRVKQNLGSLVNDQNSKNGAEGLWVNRDDCANVIDTDIKSAVGVGAYYVKIKYSDGTEKAFSKTNFFKNAEKGAALDMVTADDIYEGKTVASIEVTLLYETYAGAPGFLDIWWHEYTNWRCTFTYNFQ